MLFVQSLNGQDTLSFRNGNKVLVNVSEVGEKEIKYKRADNPDGPDYLTMTSELNRIIYKNGSIDSFKIVEVKKVDVEYAASIPAAFDSTKLQYKYRSVYFKNKNLFQKDLYKLIVACPDETRKASLLQSFDRMVKYKKQQRRRAWLGVPLAFGSLITVAAMGSFSGSSNDATNFGWAGLTAGVAVATISQVKARQSKMLRQEAMRDIIEIYNGEKIQPPPPFPSYFTGEKLRIKGITVKYGKKQLSMRQLEKLINTHPDPVVKGLMLEQYSVTKHYRKKEKVHLYVGLLVPAVILGGGVALASQDSEGYVGGVILVGAGIVSLGVSIPNLVLSEINKSKSKKALRKLVDTYNQ